LISNPLDQSKWSDIVANELDIDFAWLNSPDYTDEFTRARERLNTAMRHHVQSQGLREVERIVDDVFRQHGPSADEPLRDGDGPKKIIGEVSHSPAPTCRVWPS
jgi:hypothetical protein